MRAVEQALASRGARLLDYRIETEGCDALYRTPPRSSRRGHRSSHRSTIGAKYGPYPLHSTRAQSRRRGEAIVRAPHVTKRSSPIELRASDTALAYSGYRAANTAAPRLSRSISDAPKSVAASSASAATTSVFESSSRLLDTNERSSSGRSTARLSRKYSSDPSISPR